MNRISKNIVSAFALAMILGAAATTETRGQGVLNEILKRMDEQYKSISSLRANVTRATVNAQLGDDAEVTEGTALYLPRKGKDPLFRIDWRRPDQILAVVDKKYVMYQPRLSQAITGSTDSVNGKKETGGALAFMNMSRAQLKANYTVEYLGEATVGGSVKTWHLRLTPKTKTSYKSSELWVDKDGFPVQSKVVENNNDTTTVLLSNIKKNVTLNGASFQINLPKGTKIIKS